VPEDSALPRTRDFFTVFSSPSPEFPFWHREGNFPDNESVYSNFGSVPKRLEEGKAHELSILNAMYVDQVENAPAGGFALSAAAGASIEILEKTVPDRTFRDRILFLVSTRTPYLVKQLSLTDRQKYEAFILDWNRALVDAGFQALPLGMNYDSDFIDALHLSEKVAPRMALEIAEKVRSIAENHGWVNRK
jgi:hypothetical protein